MLEHWQCGRRPIGIRSTSHQLEAACLPWCVVCTSFCSPPIDRCTALPGAATCCMPQLKRRQCQRVGSTTNCCTCSANKPLTNRHLRDDGKHKGLNVRGCPVHAAWVVPEEEEEEWTAVAMDEVAIGGGRRWIDGACGAGWSCTTDRLQLNILFACQASGTVSNSQPHLTTSHQMKPQVK